MTHQVLLVLSTGMTVTVFALSGVAEDPVVKAIILAMAVVMAVRTLLMLRDYASKADHRD